VRAAYGAFVCSLFSSSLAYASLHPTSTSLFFAVVLFCLFVISLRHGRTKESTSPMNARMIAKHIYI
jgi:hypothetical protein